ncbi:MAG TPA: NAD-dependent succinate-semialdehyde dehydrogenase [Gemmatimonadaceae bacterium]|nr:NAD-dependent succinate-semialdehyde dehydrogenase [Gemmatimonadaceae bacterium]
MTIATINPATGETLRRFEPHDGEAVEAALARAARAFESWSRRPIGERAAVVRRAGELLDAERRELGRLMTLEMGKLHSAAVEEAAKCAASCRHYAEHAEAYLAPEPVSVDGERSYIAFDPLGAVLAVMPWNFPFWQVIRFAAPALVAGNVGLLKHASNVPQCALAIEDLFHRAGAPEGVFQTLLVESDVVAGIIADHRIAAVTLTGSERAGRAVGSAAGEHLRPSVLELGGSDPFIVLGSAAIPDAVATGVRARIINNGQSCIAAKRFIVVDSVADAFTDGFVRRMSALRVGDPMVAGTELGPLASMRQLEELESQVSRSVDAGAKVLTGGRRLDGPGAWYAPTVLTDIPREAPAYGEELFGPVASLFRVPDAAAALTLANDSRFGLAASVWTSDDREAEWLARELAVGTVFVNGMVASDPRFPFGGVKASGYGRELSAYGLREFVNVKTVRMQRRPTATSTE